MNDCCRLGARLSGSTPNASQPWDEILFCSANFVALPTLGALVEGWLLIVPRRHYLSIGAFSPALLDELRDFRAHVRAAIEIAYGPVIVFEHGPAKAGNPAGCGVDHAHLHLIPWTERWRNTVDRFAPVAMKWRRTLGMDELSFLHGLGQDYLYFEEADGEAWITSSAEIPSQFFRQVVAAATDQVDRYDWKGFSGDENVRATIFKLHSANTTDAVPVTEFACS